MLVLSREDVRALVPMATAIDLVTEAFKDLAAGGAQAPLRTPLDVQNGLGTTLVMPAYVPSVHALGLKVVSVFPQNHERGLPTITSLVTLLDEDTGQPIAIMEGGYLTALRTGAVSGAATRMLAREDARVLVVVGAGTQALTQVAAVCAVRPIERVIVVGRSQGNLGTFAHRLGTEWPGLGVEVETTTDAASAIRQADVVCAATTSRTPVFVDTDVKSGTHINGVGSFTPDMQEVPGETIARAVVVVDQLEAALEEAGDLIVPIRDGLISRSHVWRELGHLASGAHAGRTDPRDITYFKSVGNAVQDMAVGRHAAERARELGVGQTVSL